MLVQDAAALDNKLQGVRQDYHGDGPLERYAGDSLGPPRVGMQALRRSSCVV